MNEGQLYVEHILECIRRVEANVAEGRDVFMASHTLQDAVLRNLQTMAEATQRLSVASKTKHPEIPWARIAGFRNVLVHNYLGIDLQLIWSITQNEVPALKEVVLQMRTGSA